MSEELKSCPFCESKVVGFSDLYFVVLCSDCGARGPANDFAVPAWNRRSLEPYERLEALEKAYQAHLDEFNHLADCKKCKEGMLSLCNEWERLALTVCGKTDFAYGAKYRKEPRP